MRVGAVAPTLALWRHIVGFQTFDFRALTDSRLNIDNAQGTAPATLAQNVTAPMLINHIFCANTDTIAHVVNIGAGPSATPYAVCSISIAAGVGTGGVQPVDLCAVDPLLTAGGIYLAPGGLVQASVEVPVVAPHVVQLGAVGGLF
jgi:hypothetical protein